MKGGIPPTKGAPRFEVTFDLSIVRGGQPLLAEIRSVDGRAWLVPVVSQGGAPALMQLIGGSTRNDPVPAAAVRAVHAELERLYEVGGPELLALQSVGFVDGVRRPSQPGRQPDSAENLAVRARRVLEDPHGLVGASNTERDAYKRARRAGIVSDGRLTTYGEQLVGGADRARAEITTVLGRAAELTECALVQELDSICSETEVAAAVLDLVADGLIHLKAVRCTSCGDEHPGFERGANWANPDP